MFLTHQAACQAVHTAAAIVHVTVGRAQQGFAELAHLQDRYLR